MTSSTDDHKSLHRLNPFKLAEAIDNAANGKIVNVTKLSNNFLLLETNSAKQSQALLSTKSLEGIPVNITPHNSLNFTRGVIKTRDLQDMSEEDIIAELYSEGVIRCKRIKITRNSQIIQTNTYILTFNRLQLPSVINMGYLRVRVEKYIPSLRCTKCQKFGHHFSKLEIILPSVLEAVFLSHHLKYQVCLYNATTARTTIQVQNVSIVRKITHLPAKHAQNTKKNRKSFHSNTH